MSVIHACACIRQIHSPCRLQLRCGTCGWLGNMLVTGSDCGGSSSGVLCQVRLAQLQRILHTHGVGVTIKGHLVCMLVTVRANF